MKSFVSVTLALAASTLVDARGPLPGRREAGTPEDKKKIKAQLKGLISKVLPNVIINKRQDQCVEDDWYNALAQLPPVIATPLCQTVLGISPVTTTVEVTPTATLRITSTTRSRVTTITVVPPALSTVTVTATTTAGANIKRGVDIDGVMLGLQKRQGSGDSAEVTSKVASFCLYCVDNIAATKTATVTAATATATRRVQVPYVGTVSVTGPAPDVTTVTDVVTADAVSTPATTTYDGPIATPTAEPIVCPDDDCTDTTQIVHGRIYNYRVECFGDLLDDNIAERSYSTFTECVSACSLANDGVNGAACLGVSYVESINNGSSNCFLKRSAFLGVSNDDGASIAILQRVGVPAARNPEVLSANTEPFASSTSVSGLDDVLPATDALPIITPAPVNAFVASASIDESTFYTSSYTSAHSSGNGSWTDEYYSTWSGAWAGAQPVAASTSSEVATVGGAGVVATGMSSESRLEGSGAILRNQTVVINGANYTEITQNLRYIYPNGTVFDRVIVTTYGSRTPSSGSVSSGSFSDSSSSSNTTISETTSVVIIVRQTTISSSSNNHSGSSYISNGGNDYLTTTLYDTTTYETNGPTSTTASSSASSGGGGSSTGGSTGSIGSTTSEARSGSTADPLSTSYGNSSTTVTNTITSETTQIITTTYPPINSSSGVYIPPSPGPSSSFSLTVTAENRTISSIRPTTSKYPPLPPHYPPYYPPHYPHKGKTRSSRSKSTSYLASNSTTTVGPTGTGITTTSSSSTPFPMSNSTITTGPSGTGTSPPITFSSDPRNFTSFTSPPVNSSTSYTITSYNTTFTGYNTTITSTPTFTSEPRNFTSLTSTSNNYTIPYSTYTSTTGCPTVTVGTVTMTSVTTVTADTCTTSPPPGPQPYPPSYSPEPYQSEPYDWPYDDDTEY